MQVVLLRDGSWPVVPGVCCWRHGVAAALTAAGGTVTELTRQPRVTARAGRPGVAAPSQRALTWLPPAVRRPLALVYRQSRAIVDQAWQPRQRTRQRGRPAGPELAGAALVIAESPAVAAAAISAGTPPCQIWVLALPPDRLVAGDPGEIAAELIAVAPVVAGFLADSEPGRESIERAASRLRPRVEVFPPVAVDRSCPSCAGSAASQPPADAPPAVARLAGWRWGNGSVTAVSSPRRPWGVGGPATSPAVFRPEPEGDRSAAAQLRTARALLDARTPDPGQPRRPARRALLAGFDLKFAADLADRLHQRSGIEMTVDDWPALGRRTPHTESRLAQAESIFAEWARTSAVWISQRKRPDQLLVVRLHRFELDSAYPRDIAIDNVDAVVYIAPLFGRRIRAELGWPAEKLVYIPNFIDLDWLARPKLPEARFALGLVGIEWARKRFDLALDVLAALRRQDLRFSLVVRSVLPWENQYAWATPEERAYVDSCFSRIERDPMLRGGVFFDPPGRDMARWYRRVGHVLSTSDEEGCHTAVAEGMASGAVPVVRPWPGADEVYGKEWIHPSADAATAAILENADAARWEERAARATTEIRRSYDPAAVVAAWADLLHGDIAAARRHFADFAPLEPLGG